MRCPVWQPQVSTRISFHLWRSAPNYTLQKSVLAISRPKTSASSEVIRWNPSLTRADINEAGGWANALGAVTDTVSRLRAAGVKFVGGGAKELIYGNKDGRLDVTGVRTGSGDEYTADLVIACMGSWTPTLLPELGSELLPTGQVLATIQLTPQELSRYKDVPVTRTIDNGFYIFPVSTVFPLISLA